MKLEGTPQQTGSIPEKEKIKAPDEERRLYSEIGPEEEHLSPEQRLIFKIFEFGPLGNIRKELAGDSEQKQELFDFIFSKLQRNHPQYFFISSKKVLGIKSEVIELIRTEMKNLDYLKFVIMKQRVEYAKKYAPYLSPEVISLKDVYAGKDKGLKSKLTKATIPVQNLFDFKLAMGLLGASEKLANKFLAHENAHANKTEAVGAEFLGYRVHVFKNKNDKYWFGASVVPNYPKEWSKEKKIEMDKLVTAAPEEYGEKLSRADTKDLEKLNNPESFS